MREKHGRIIPSLAFFHIPVYATSAFEQIGVDPYKEPGINDNVPLQMQGLKTDGQMVWEYEGADIPFMSALLQTEGLVAAFSGHDHGDDWYALFFIWLKPCIT